ncbi:glutamic-type intramembrane protease PrsW [Kurthia sibirica]|uniref:Protease PrsW n=1 Tax=Kurthia sibirica TaxID=202750 RepID=A0A2U3AIP7_9BACL|nr:glutamic-type intramembrane protease PrsW [Kurthia sibirica]PWI24426.1 PrsW family intramembrane metalloprotease [Kurthia sibirica]GEK35606.1 protease PrsW [Kurthia sibirica]
MIVLLTVAIAPGLALFSFFYLRNQMKTEPRKTLLQTFIYGAILTFPIMFLQYVFKEEQVFTHPIIQEVFFTGIIEEFFKWLILLLVLFNNVEFDDPYDGVLYGAAISLGFATVENIFYLMSYGVHTAFLRAILPVSSHALFGVVMGYYLGRAKFDVSSSSIRFKSLALLAPLTLHIVYNLIFISQKHWVYIMIPFMLFLWWFSLKKVKTAHMALVELIVNKNKDSPYR